MFRKLKYRLFSPLLIAFLTIFLFACTSIEQHDNNQAFANPPEFYANLAAQKSGSERQRLLLQATAAYFYHNEYEQGRTLIYGIKQNTLSAENNLNYQLLAAELAIHDNQAARGLSILASLDNNPLMANTTQVKQLQLRALAQQQQEQFVASIKTLIQLNTLLPSNAQDQNQHEIWQQTNQLSSKTLQTLSADSSDPVLQGWAALAQTTRTYKNQPQILLQQLRYWSSQYPEHPANSLVSTDIKNFQAWLTPPKQIAVLLPLQGGRSAQAQAIMNGILVAYYQAQEQKIAVPIIKTYDTSQSTDISQLYQPAVGEGASFVIGPLLKSNVESLAQKGNISVPTLALNYPSDSSSPIKNLYFFALSPENEAIAIANRASQLAYTNAAIISPTNAWASNINTVFSTQWQQDGGNVLDTFTYTSSTPLRKRVSALLNVDQSQARKRQLQKLLKQPLKFSARRRQDIDMIYLNATPTVARQIMPLLRYYYAGDIPVYASSQIYNGMVNTARDNDLNGIRFPIMPWAINPSPQAKLLRQKIVSLWPQSFKAHSLLYAFGIDAYTLMTHMSQLEAFPKFGFSANTGTLYLAPNQRIVRQLEWAEFNKGKPSLLTNTRSFISN